LPVGRRSSTGWTCWLAMCSLLKKNAGIEKKAEVQISDMNIVLHSVLQTVYSLAENRVRENPRMLRAFMGFQAACF